MTSEPIPNEIDGGLKKTPGGEAGVRRKLGKALRWRYRENLCNITQRILLFPQTAVGGQDFRTVKE